jgi:hypothetical protein
MGQIDADKMYDNVMKWDWGIVMVTSTMIPKHAGKVLLTEQISLD